MDIDARQGRGLWKLDCLVSIPSCALVVSNQHNFFDREIGFNE